MAHHDHRPAALAPQPAEDLQHPVAGGGVEAGGGLVEDEHLGVAHQGDGEQHQAALASGQLPGVALQGPPAEADGVEDLGAAGVGRLAAPPEMDLLGFGQLQADPEDGVEGGGRLHGHGDPPPPDLAPPVLVEGGEVDIAEMDGALDGGLAGQAQHAPAERRLARPRFAEDAEALAGGDRQREIVDGPDGRRPRIGDPQPGDRQVGGS